MYGHVCFALTKNKWYDALISKITRSKWSHTFLTCPPMLGMEMLIEADSHGVSTISFEIGYRNNPNESYEVYHFDISKDIKDRAIKNRIKELEVSYNFLAYFWFIWRYLNQSIGRNIKKQDNWSSGKSEICSNLVREYIEDCGYKELFKDFGKGSASPEDVYQIVLEHPELFRVTEKKN